MLTISTTGYNNMAIMFCHQIGAPPPPKKKTKQNKAKQKNTTKHNKKKKKTVSLYRHHTCSYQYQIELNQTQSSHSAT